MNIEFDPIDHIPNYYVYNDCNRSNGIQGTSFCRTLLTHILAMILVIAICAGVYYYYETIYVMNIEDADKIETNGDSEETTNQINDMKEQISHLKSQLEKNERSTKDYIEKIYRDQELFMQNEIAKALDIYDADKVGLFDYASSYSGGKICSTPDTLPYPLNTTITIMKFFRVDLFSNPESILQPQTLPGSCFAFKGSTGRIRIQLAKRIEIKSVTMDYPTVNILEDYSSSPREFEVYGLFDEFIEPGSLLGKFSFNSEGRPYQTFDIESSSSNMTYEYVELRILNNYGNTDYTCVYRFRVHNRSKLNTFVKT